MLPLTTSENMQTDKMKENEENVFASLTAYLLYLVGKRISFTIQVTSYINIMHNVQCKGVLK